MSRGQKARARRRIRRQSRSVALGVGKAQDQTPETLTADADVKRAAVGLSNGRIVRLQPGRRAAVRRALVAAGVESTVEPVTVYDLADGTLAERKFFAAVIGAGFSETRRASWPSEAELGDHGDVLFRDDGSGVFQLDDGSIVLVTIRSGWCSLRVASASRDDAVTVVDTFAAAYPPLYRSTSEDGTVVPITFWTNTSYGPSSRLRMIGSAEWADIERNYTADVQAELGRLMNDFEPGKDGQLLLWQGEPGTGKTWALRALATQWKDWAEFSYITDPDAFFVRNPSYMIDVLLHESYESLTVDGDVVEDEKSGGKWRVLILEDTGELLAAEAKDAYGQGLSRLLNVVDGMVGQGLRVLAIVTTNDELGDLHPAVTRPGRCASQLSFGPLSADEAAAWLGDPDGSYEPMTLAELYDAAKKETAQAFATDDDGDEPNMGTCETCNHSARAHGGTMNDGACSLGECDCTGFKAAASTEAAAEAVTAAAADVAVELPEEHTPGQTMPRRNPSPKAPAPTMPTGELQWTATLAPEGRATDDGRIFAPGSITWRELPLSLMAMTKTADGHDGAEVAGRIDRIWREGGMIRGAGIFDGGEFGQEIARMVADGTLRGVSVDIAPQKVEVAYRRDVVDEDGNWKEPLAEEDEQEETETPSLVDLLLGNPEDDVIYVVQEAVLGMATVCPFQAFADATITVAASLVADASPMVWTVTGQAGWTVTARSAPVAAEGLAGAPEADEALTASAAGIAPVSPPASWFEDPALPELTALTVTPEGRVYGHAAPWGLCHIGLPNGCTTAPSSVTGYSYFHLKEVECDEGVRLAVGTITLDTGHADKSLSRIDAARHYDDTGTAVADVIVGEDDHGIWVAGALRGDVDAETARKLRGAALSGDWRSVNGNLELVALLAVNVPGFPIPRPTASLVASADGWVPESLLAAGVHLGLGGLTSAQRAQFDALRAVHAGEWDALREQLG